MRRLSILASLLTACASASPPPAPSPAAPSTPSTTPSTANAAQPPRYLAMFDDLVERIAREHEFAPGYARDVGHAWRDEVPTLRAEMARATDRTAALVTLRHLQNSLRDAHCHLDPPADRERRNLSLGVRLWTGGTEAAPDVRVEEVTDPDAKAALSLGDTIVAVDGVPLARWLAEHHFEASALPPDRWLSDTLQRIRGAELPWSPIEEGDTRTLSIVHAGTTREVTLHFHRHFPETEHPDLDHPVPMAQVACDAGAPVDYGDYALTAMGVNVCIYQPTKPARPRVAVVRYPSFAYGSGDEAQSLRMVRVDHEILTRALHGVDGVVVDLHENYGGNNPFIFLGWFSGGPWDHERVVTRVLPGLDTATISAVLFGEDHMPEYLAARTAGRPSILTRFLCSPGHCDHVAPDDSERVTHAPVALVIGPGCVSSCDSFALTWATYKLGPLVGKQPAHAYTVHRLPIHLAGPGSEDLGTFRVALSRSEMREGASIEGEPLPLDWEARSSFDTRKSWVREAVEEARKRVVKR